MAQGNIGGGTTGNKAIAKPEEGGDIKRNRDGAGVIAPAFGTRAKKATLGRPNF